VNGIVDFRPLSQNHHMQVRIATHVMMPERGTFVAKIFRGSSVDFMYSQLRTLFARVSVAKPSASRNSSMEAFVVCEGFYGGMYQNLPLHSLDLRGHDDGAGETYPISLLAVNLPFIACGDLSNWDSDRMVLDADKSYPLEPREEYIPPVSPPIKPPYHCASTQAKTKADNKKAESESFE
jgi:tRNA (cytidine32/guanosine34-2'-O)-methyltransferase